MTLNTKLASETTTPFSEYGFTAWVVVFTASLFFFYEFIQLNMFNSINFEVREAFGLTAEQVGFLSATSLWANVIFLFPAGLLLDRFSTRKIILVTLFLCILGTLLFSLADNVTVAFLGRFFAGIGSAFCFLSAVRLASRWFSHHHLALIIGLIVTMAMLGGIAAQLPLTMLVKLLGWRHALWVDVGLGVVILFLVSRYVIDYPPGFEIPFSKTPETKAHFFKVLKQVATDKQNWLAGLYTCFMNLPIILLGAVWGIPYIERVFHLNASNASSISSAIFLGVIIGSPLVGWFSDKISRRRLPMLFGAVLSLLVIFAIMYMPGLSTVGLFILFGLLGLISSTQVLSYPLVTESNPLTITATAVSVISLSTQGGGALLQPFFGWLMDWHPHRHFLHKAIVYSSDDFHRAIWLLPIGFIIALIASFGLRETHCEHQKET